MFLLNWLDGFGVQGTIILLCLAALIPLVRAKVRKDEAMKRQLIQVAHEAGLQTIRSYTQSGRQLQMERRNLYSSFRTNANELVDALDAEENYAGVLHATRKDLGNLEWIASAETLEAARQMHAACTKWANYGDRDECLAAFYEVEIKFVASSRKDIDLDPIITPASDKEINRPRRSTPRPPESKLKDQYSNPEAKHSA
jgi:hypothetical protein